MSGGSTLQSIFFFTCNFHQIYKNDEGYICFFFLQKLSSFIDWCCYYTQVSYTGSWEPLVFLLFQENAINCRRQEEKDKSPVNKGILYTISIWSYYRERRDRFIKKNEDIWYPIKFWFQSKIVIIFGIWFYFKWNIWK